jgi:hypothetical protein
MIARSTQDPVGCDIAAHRKERTPEGEFAGSKFASITDPVASSLYHQRGQLRNHTEHAFFELAGHCVDGYLIKIHGSEIFFE